MFARILYESGFDTLEKVANADYIQLIPLEKGNMSKKTFTEDQLRLVRSVMSVKYKMLRTREPILHCFRNKNSFW